MIHAFLRPKKWAILLFSGALLFGVGLVVLRCNPYWRSKPGTPELLDHRVYLWGAAGHLACGLGLLALALSIAIFLARRLPKKTVWLYWLLTALTVIVCWNVFGVYHTYAVNYAWDRSRGGITELEFYGSKPNWFSRQVVRWQVKAELANYIAAGPLRRTHGTVSVRVLTIVPIADVTLACDCIHCCTEEADARILLDKVR